ncbi:MAG: ATP-binding protein [Tannerellaceae bacterium]|nr:ATP-binding protein [Tannerellaceae bacterium]
MKNSLDIASGLHLLYNQNNFSIRFDAQEFTTPGNIRYEYLLRGLDNDWQFLPQGNRTAVYTNVPPGKYLFMVKASFPGGELKQSQLEIHISPPWWFTWWAKTFYVLLFVMIAYGVYHLLKSRQREKVRMLEQAHNEELAQAKLRFFTDISHEIRTPLTLVISPLLKLIQEDGQQEHQAIYQTMQRNANRILRLVNQLLDIRKIDKKQMKLRVRETDVISFVNDIMDSFQPLSLDKQIRFSFSSRQIPDTVWLDIDFLDKILYNLLSNAFKFTPSGGEISVSLSVHKKDELTLQVADNGKGISPEHLRSIFERFYQVSDRKKMAGIGTGIGLHLTKMLVELHHGQIEVSSTPEQGSLFTITIPCNRLAYDQEEISDTPLEYNGASIETVPPLLIPEEDLAGEKTEGSKQKPLILIVEDHADIRSLLRGELEQRFRILETGDGKKGYELATQYLPDLIITDIMMPVSDGIEMTMKLRGNHNTRSIPVIMLTARTTMESTIEGVEAGADVYIPKPFDLRYLMAHVVNLLNKQLLLKARVRTEQVVKPEDVHIQSADEKLMEKLNLLIKERISDSDLSIERISKELGISRVHLHRKLKEAYQLSPSIYLRNIRLEHAACMLKSKKISIAEVAYAVGFSSHQYFSNCFKDFYGMSPLEYAEKNRTAESTDI